MDFHPFIVHFPIALLITAAGFDIVGVARDKDWLLRAGHVLLGIGCLAAIAAAVTGDSAAAGVRHIPGIVEPLEQHEDLGTASAGVSALLLLVRTRSVLKGRFVGGTRRLYLVVAISLSVLVAACGYTGGQLVYTFGAGTAVTSDAAPPIDRGTP